jgi:F-box-like
MTLTPDPPPEVWAQIFTFYQGPPRDLTSVCKKWTDIVYGTPVLWAHITLGPHQFVEGGLEFLTTWLKRVKVCPLHVTIRATNLLDASIVAHMCGALAKAVNAIKWLDISTDTEIFAGQLYYRIVLEGGEPHTPTILESLAIEVDDSKDETLICDGMYLKELLSHAESFPALRSLTLPALWPSLPVPPPQLPTAYASLNTLVISGPFPCIPDALYSTICILHFTTQLQTLWFKVDDNDSFMVVKGRTTLPRGLHYAPTAIPAHLPLLTSVTVTVPGSGCDLLTCIDAPVLRDLHLDGSRPVPDVWPTPPSDHIMYALQKVATRSPGLRRLALTEATLPETAFKWLLSGDPLRGEIVDNQPGVVPFQNLETLALRDCAKTYVCGLTDGALLRYADAPGVTLRRLVLHHCESVSLDAILQALDWERHGWEGPPEVEIVASPLVKEHHAELIRTRRIPVTWAAPKKGRGIQTLRAVDRRWERFYSILEEEHDLSEENWDDKPTYDEDPWWILELKSIDPTDSLVY